MKVWNSQKKKKLFLENLNLRRDFAEKRDVLDVVIRKI